jgi:hypothetical protein
MLPRTAKRTCAAVVIVILLAFSDMAGSRSSADDGPVLAPRPTFLTNSSYQEE